MSHELHYTSAPKGLKAGSKGFCTVACTSGIPVVLAERLENLSGYRQVYPPHDPNAGRNPACRSHLLFGQGGQTVSILSRVGFAGLDYTDRSNKYAHHVALAPDERPEGGPAWLASQPGFLEAAWQGDPQTLAQGRRPPRGDRPAARCGRWQSQTGDAGWAGVLAETFLNEPRKAVYLIVPIDLDPLPLLVEALALVPPDRRWEVTFSTYFTALPPGMACAWRCVLANSPEATQCRRMPDALVLDLTGPLGTAQGGPIVEQARTGIAPPQPRIRPEAPAAKADDPRPRRDDRTRPGPEPIGPGHGMIPDLPPPIPPDEKIRLGGRRGVGSKRQPSSMTYQFAGILAGCAALLVGGVWVVQRFVRDPGKKPAFQVARNDPDPARGRPQADPPPRPNVAPKPPEPSPPVDPGGGGRLAAITLPESNQQPKQTANPPPPAHTDPNPVPDRVGRKIPAAEGPKPLKFWGLPRNRSSGEVKSEKRTAPDPWKYSVDRPIQEARLIGMNDGPIKDQRIAARPRRGESSLDVIREAGSGSEFSPANKEMPIGTFRWNHQAIEFEMVPDIRSEKDTISAFLDCILEVQVDGGPPEYLFLTDPDMTTFTLPDSMDKPRPIEFDRAGVFDTAKGRRTGQRKSTRQLILLACRFQSYAYTPSPGEKPPPWKPGQEIRFVPVGEGKLARPESGKPEITATLEERTGALLLDFKPTPKAVQDEYDRDLGKQKEVYAKILPLQGRLDHSFKLSEEESRQLKALKIEFNKLDDQMKKALDVNSVSNQVLASGIEITVGFEAGGELFVLPTIRSPKLAKPSAPGGG